MSLLLQNIWTLQIMCYRWQYIFPTTGWKRVCIQHLDLIMACFSMQNSIGYVLRYVAAERIWVLVLCGPVQLQRGSHRIKAKLLAVLLDCWCLCAVLLSSLISLAALCTAWQSYLVGSVCSGYVAPNRWIFSWPGTQGCIVLTQDSLEM